MSYYVFSILITSFTLAIKSQKHLFPNPTYPNNNPWLLLCSYGRQCMIYEFRSNGDVRSVNQYDEQK